MADAKPGDDLLVLCARVGLRLFEDYVIGDGDITIVTEQGERKLKQAAVRDTGLAQLLYDASGVEIEKMLDHGTMPPALRRRLRRRWQRSRAASAA
jgi:hypothetical protein